MRVFSPRALVALHGDPDAKLVAGIAGTTVWWVRPVHAMTQLQHENLLRGEFFLPFTDHAEELRAAARSGRRVLRPGALGALARPSLRQLPASRSTSASTRATTCATRKVYDVNWLMRKAHLSPGGPGGRLDRLKCLTFDGISTVTRRGLQYRGHV